MKINDFGNKHAPFGDDDIAASITLTGQAVIKMSNTLLKQYITERTGITDEEVLNKCIVYNDTDSSYISITPLIEHLNIKLQQEDKTITPELKVEMENIVTYLNEKINEWGEKSLNSTDCRFIFKREILADTGVFLMKKRYALHVLDDEGIAVNKYKYTGVEVVRSTMPAAIKPYVKNIIETMLSTQDITKTNAALSEAYNIFKKLPIEDIAFVSGLNDYDKYATKCNGFVTAKGMPIHVKASYFHNEMLKIYGIENDYESIGGGDKVRYFYIQKPNAYNLATIAYKYYLPDEFRENFHVDYELMFEKIIFKAIERFYNTVQWPASKPSNAVKSSLLDLLSDD